MVAQVILVHLVEVRILVGQQIRFENETDTALLYPFFCAFYWALTFILSVNQHVFPNA